MISEKNTGQRRNSKNKYWSVFLILDLEGLEVKWGWSEAYEWYCKRVYINIRRVFIKGLDAEIEELKRRW